MMLNRALAFLFSLTLMVSIATDARAFDVGKLSGEEQRLYAEVDRYLRGITSLQSRFVQLSSNGEYAEGLMFMRRPGRMRVEYLKPDTALILADGEFFTYVDKESGQATHVYLKLTPASILLDQNLSLTSEELIVTGFERSPGIIRATIVRKSAPDDAKITLVFNDQPITLRKWTVLDGQGITTDVSLVGARFDVAIPDKVFTYDAPAPVQGGN